MTSASKSDAPWRYAHPLAFALARVIALYSVNEGDVGLKELIRPLAGTLALGSLAFALAMLLARRDRERAALATSAFLMLFFAYGVFDTSVHQLQTAYNFVGAMITNGLPAGGKGEAWGALTFVLWAAAVITAVSICLRVRRERLAGVTAAAWIAGFALTGPTLWRIGARAVNKRSVVAAITVSPLTPLSVPSIHAGPDLFVIVLDAYVRQDVLRQMYDFDNEPFLAGLEKRGFTVARHSRANYDQTPLALGAALNLDYLKPDDTKTSLDGMQPRIDRNRIAALLRERGYHFVSVPTGFDGTATPSADLIRADHASESPWATASLTPFEEMLCAKTPFVLFPSGWKAIGFALHRQRILAAFKHLGEVAALPYPKFVFAHILAPHPPFVFGPDGARPPVGQSVFLLGDASDYLPPWHVYKAGYVGQMRFVNQRILATLDDIQAKETRPYVVVLMGDHGSRSHTDWHSRAKTDVREVFSNLYAVRCPPGQGDAAAVATLRERLGGTVTPVTGLRLVMNAYFGGTLPDLPDRSLYSTADHPFDFYDVSGDLPPAK